MNILSKILGFDNVITRLEEIADKLLSLSNTLQSNSNNSGIQLQYKKQKALLEKKKLKLKSVKTTLQRSKISSNAFA